jgi:hypothetical protein
MPNEETTKLLNDIKGLIRALDGLCDAMYDRGCLDISNEYDKELCGYIDKMKKQYKVN